MLFKLKQENTFSHGGCGVLGGTSLITSGSGSHGLHGI
jgi:hypothetical protein